MFKRIIISPFDNDLSAVICKLDNKYYFLIEYVEDYSDIGCDNTYEPQCLLEIGTDGKFHAVKNKHVRSDIESYMDYNYDSLEYSIVNNLYNIIYSNVLDTETIEEFIKENTGIDISFTDDYNEYINIPENFLGDF